MSGVKHSARRNTVEIDKGFGNQGELCFSLSSKRSSFILLMMRHREQRHIMNAGRNTFTMIIYFGQVKTAIISFCGKCRTAADLIIENLLNENYYLLRLNK